jgi:hypothetical protein
MKVVDIANEIYSEAGNPSTTSIPAIAFWIRAKVGAINNLLFESFTIDDTTFEIKNANGEISPDAVAIIKQMYKLYDYEVQIRANMNALLTDSILRVEDQGSSVTKINRNEVSKTLQAIRKDEITLLNQQVNAYRSGSSLPSQVAGDDTVQGSYPPFSVYYRR